MSRRNNSMPPPRDRGRINRLDMADLHRADFPGAGLAVLRHKGFVVAWEDSSGETHTTQTMPSERQADKLLAEIIAGDLSIDRGGDERYRNRPVRNNLRVVEARE